MGDHDSILAGKGGFKEWEVGYWGPQQTQKTPCLVPILMPIFSSPQILFGNELDGLKH